MRNWLAWFLHGKTDLFCGVYEQRRAKVLVGIRVEFLLPSAPTGLSGLHGGGVTGYRGASGWEAAKGRVWQEPHSSTQWNNERHICYVCPPSPEFTLCCVKQFGQTIGKGEACLLNEAEPPGKSRVFYREYDRYVQMLSRHNAHANG